MRESAGRHVGRSSAAGFLRRQWRRKLQQRFLFHWNHLLCFHRRDRGHVPHPGNPKLTIAKVGDISPSQAGYTSYSETPGFKAWQEQTGITAEIVEPADSAAILLMLSSDSVPDIVCMNKNIYPGGTMKMVEDGLAINLSEHMDDWCPDYKALLESSDQYKIAATEVDGNVYTFEGYGFELNSPYRSWQGMVARQEYLDQLNMEVPTTVDEFYDFLKAMKDQLGVETPLIGETWCMNNAFSKGYLTSPFDLPTTDRYHDGDTVKWGAYQPEYKDFLEFMNKLYTEKLMDNNYAATDGPTIQATFVQGNAGVIVASASKLSILKNAADNADDFNLVAIPNIVKEKGDRPMYGLSDPYFSTNYTTYVTGDCKNPEAAVKFLNYLHTEAGSMLYNFGIGGESYEMVDGKPVLTDLITKNSEYSLDQMLRVYGLTNWPGIQKIEMSEQRFPLESQRHAYEVWSDTDVDKYQIVNASILPDLNDEYAALYADVSTFMSENTAKFIAGTQPLSEFDSYMDTLKSMGMDRLMEIIQQSYDAYNK